MKSHTFTIRFLWVTGFLLQAFSLMVSFRPLNDFLGAYLTNDSIRLFFSVAALLFIEAGVFGFLDMALAEIKDFTESVAIRGFAILFIALSGFLTYQGSATIAVSNLTPLAMAEKPSDLLRVEEQLETDRERMAQIGAFQKTRNNNWLTPGEVAELQSLQVRIDQNDELLREQFTRLQAQNDQIKLANQQRQTDQATVHHNFGFLTQLFLVMVFLARHVLQERYERSDPQFPTPRNNPETEGKPEPKPDQKPRNPLEITISEPTLQSIGKLTLEGLSNQEIADRLNIGKGTVSKARYQIGKLWVKDGIPLPEVAGKLNIDPAKLTEKLNGSLYQ